MKRIVCFGCILFVTLGTTIPVLAQNLIIYPAKGQSQEQMEKDKFDCYSWAKQQTGVDPMVASAASQQPAGSQGSTVRGAARGAAVGAGIGAIAGDAGKGAAVGAAFGGLRGHRQRREAEQVQQQQVSQTNQRISEYNRAYGACLEAKGYTVK
ncbi:MAG: hypothetical protein CV087_00030 [Candidatus Brocadia sp. WS118]|nr:MAG: hypothetical protein CV087_00030 [Candidatus Brocadia sp. WS118]